MAWLLIVATIPAGIIGLAFEHSLRTLFAKPLAAAIFLTLNGVILLVGERLRRRRTSARSSRAPTAHSATEEGRRLDTLDFKEAGAVGVAQIGALFAGISRSGITMVAGLVRGLDHEDAARFSFLLATPIILAAGVYKLPDLAGHLGDGIRGQASSAASSPGSLRLLRVRFLDAVLRDPHPHAVRDLLPRRRGDLHHPLRLMSFILCGRWLPHDW